MYDFSLDKNSTSEKIVDTINEYGICVIDSYLNNFENIKKETVNFVNSYSDGEYDFGKASRVLKESIKNKYPNIYNLFSSEFMEECVNGYSKSHKKINEWIFSTHDYKNIGILARNGFLHFDRLHCFKFFFYLTDVSESDGPFSVVPKSHKKGRELRTNSWKNSSGYDKTKNRIKIYFPELYNENEIVSITGKAGTLIIFDTDIFHKGGETNGGERMVIRSHTYLK